MRNQLTILIAGLTLTATMWAQQTPANPGAEAVRGPAHMFQGLNLTADQRAKIQTLFQTEHSQIQALRSNTSLTEDQKKEQVRELRKNDHQQLLAVLTPEQQAKLKEVRHQRMARRAGFKAGRRFQALNLSAEQKSQLQPIFQSTRQQMQALRADTSLTPEQKHEKMHQIRQNQVTQMKSILTPEQQQQLQQRRGRHMRKGAEPQTPPSA